MKNEHKGEKGNSYVKDRQKERIGERAKEEYDSTTPTPHPCLPTRVLILKSET